MIKLYIIPICTISIFLASCKEEKKYIEVKLPSCKIMIDENYGLTKGENMLLIKPTNLLDKGYYHIQYLGKGLEGLGKKILNKYTEPKSLVHIGHLKIIKIGSDPINTEISFILTKNFLIKYKKMNNDILKIIESCNDTWEKEAVSRK